MYKHQIITHHVISWKVKNLTRLFADLERVELYALSASWTILKTVASICKLENSGSGFQSSA
jgi:hypothetical protein